MHAYIFLHTITEHIYTYMYICIYIYVKIHALTVLTVAELRPPRLYWAIAPRVHCCHPCQPLNMCANVFQCILVYHSALQCIAVGSSVFIWQSHPECIVAIRARPCMCVAVCYNVLQCVAVRCSALQCLHFQLPLDCIVAIRAQPCKCFAERCMVLQCVAWCCSALQCRYLAIAPKMRCHPYPPFTYVAVCHNVVWCVIVCCSAFQCMLQCVAVRAAVRCSACCSALQCVLQCVAVRAAVRCSAC